LWDSVLAQFIATPLDRDAALGLVTLYNARMADGWCYLAALSAPSAIGTGQIVEGVYLLVEHAFGMWPLRKIYVEAAAYNVAQFESVVGRYFCEEGRLADHVFYNGRYWDLVTFSLSRARWEAERHAFGSIGSGLPIVERVLDLDEFVTLASPIIRGSAPGHDEEHLDEHLALDSMAVLQLAHLVDELTGAEPDLDDLLRSEVSLRDVYKSYLTAAHRPLRHQAHLGGAAGTHAVGKEYQQAGEGGA
jgi:hypothetical protein